MTSSGEDHGVFAAIKDQAFRAVGPGRLGQVNLYLDHRVREAGEQLGPAFQGLRAPQPSVLVFVDDEPTANFGHPCRYLLFDPGTGELRAELPARFPPWEARIPSSLEAFHQPVRPAPTESLHHVKPELRCPILFPRGRRHAIFYAGMSNTRHLNDMEFGYRTLVHRCGFEPRDITVLSFDGTTDTQEGANTIWPGDGTPYQIVVNGPGTQAAFEAAVDALKPRLHEDDLLFIHANNHGDNFGSGSFLSTHPSWGEYFAAKLGREYIVWWWWWCWILREVLERPYRELPEAEYYARLRGIEPELSKLTAVLDDQSAVLRKEMTATVSELVAGAFGADR